MTELVFDCVGARAERYAVAPTLSLTLRIAETDGVAVDAIALRVQIRVLPHLRRYSDDESGRLVEVFGEPSRWADTLKPLQFALLTA
ncbi:MAG TPA: DUF6084 family protein, partial [Pseudonocardiaceae bacterium]